MPAEAAQRPVGLAVAVVVEVADVPVAPRIPRAAAPPAHAVVLVAAALVPPVAVGVVVVVVVVVLVLVNRIAMRSKYISIFIIVIVLAAIGGGVYYFETKIIVHTPDSYSATNSVYDVLKFDNTLFALGDSLATQGNMPAAEVAYEKALPTAADQYQTGVIMFKIAITQWVSDPIGSITPLEAIATNPNYANSTRAYALQYIAQAHDNSPIPLSASQIQQLDSVTFASSPFSEMLVDGDKAFAYRHIYDLADSLYPLPLPEALSAYWYAEQILVSTTPPMSSSTEAIYQSKIQDDFTALDSAVQTESSDPTLNIFAARALQIKAGILGRFSYLGLASKEDAAAAYQHAVESFDTVTDQPYLDGIPRYYEATFLAYAYGASQTVNIQDVLAPIDTDPGYINSYIGTYLKGVSAATSVGHAQAVFIAGFDPKFKSFLISLGWSPSNFGS